MRLLNKDADVDDDRQTIGLARVYFTFNLVYVPKGLLTKIKNAKKKKLNLLGTHGKMET